MNRITFRHTEVSLASEQYAFGGTLDAVGMIGNELILLDWKTPTRSTRTIFTSSPPTGCSGTRIIPTIRREQGDFSHHYFPSLDDGAETFLLMRDLFDRVKKAERRVR